MHQDHLRQASRPTSIQLGYSSARCISFSGPCFSRTGFLAVSRLCLCGASPYGRNRNLRGTNVTVTSITWSVAPSPATKYPPGH